MRIWIQKRGVGCLLTKCFLFISKINLSEPFDTASNGWSLFFKFPDDLTPPCSSPNESEGEEHGLRFHGWCERCSGRLFNLSATYSVTTIIFYYSLLIFCLLNRNSLIVNIIIQAISKRPPGIAKAVAIVSTPGTKFTNII